MDEISIINDPNLDQLYLSDMIGPDHPQFERLRDRYGKTPEGKRVEAFRDENEKNADGLEIATHSKLDNILRNESVEFSGDRLDRVAKIRAIRLHRSRVEDAKLKLMTKEEREIYIEEAKAHKARDVERATRRLGENQAHVDQRRIERETKRTAIEELRYKRDVERRERQEKNRAFLDEELARRKKAIDPVTARKRALEEREKKERELNEKADDEGQDDVELPAGDLPTEDHVETQEGGAEGQREARKLELQAMNKPALEARMKELGLTLGVGMSNEKRVDSILAAEFTA